jgi:hypothetical protein
MFLANYKLVAILIQIQLFWIIILSKHRSTSVHHHPITAQKHALIKNYNGAVQIFVMM